MSASKVLERRRRATQATVDKFREHPLDWKRYDCGRMLAFHLVKMRRPFLYKKAGKWGSALEAKRSLARLGFASMTELMDSKFERIAPAAALLGDVIALDGDEAMGAIGIALGNNAVFCYHEEAPDGPIAGRILEASIAWRIL